MHEPESIQALLKAIDSLSTVVKNEAPTSDETGNTNSCTNSTRQKLDEFHKIFEKERKCTDPKIIEQQKKLPITKKRDELLKVIFSMIYLIPTR